MKILFRLPGSHLGPRAYPLLTGSSHAPSRHIHTVGTYVQYIQDPNSSMMSSLQVRRRTNLGRLQVSRDGWVGRLGSYVHVHVHARVPPVQHLLYLGREPGYVCSLGIE